MAWVNVAEAQQTGKVYRIGFIDFRLRSATTDPRLIALRQGLSELGYIEGQNLVREYRSAKGKRERLPEVAAELVRLKVDVIVTSSAPPAIRAAQRATHTIPIVMAGSGYDPVKAGIVVSLARPGGNITGLTNLATKLHPKRLELLKEAFPRISRVAILWPRHHYKQGMREIEAAGQALGIQIQYLDVHRSGGIESVFSAISRERPDGLLVGLGPLIISRQSRIAEFTAKRGLPTIYSRVDFVDAGGLMSYDASSQDTLRRVATYVDKILKGAKPGDLPIERSTKFHFAINLKTAKQMGITIPPEVLYRATKVIK